MEKYHISKNDALITRRDLLQKCFAAGLAAGVSSILNPSFYGGVLMDSEQLISAKSALDHIILGASDLDQAIVWFEKTTGVKPVPGGVHPGRGTRNALVSLGGAQYLEILAPDPAQQGVPMKYDLKALTTPRLIHWVAVTKDISQIVEKARSAGLNPIGPRDGSRARPDGRMLKWAYLDVVKNENVTLIPFFIQWAADSFHPSQDSPAGCELQSLEMGHPRPESIIKILGMLGIKSEVKKSNEARLNAALKTPKGNVILS